MFALKQLVPLDFLQRTSSLGFSVLSAGEISASTQGILQRALRRPEGGPQLGLAREVLGQGADQARGYRAISTVGRSQRDGAEDGATGTHRANAGSKYAFEVEQKARESY